MSTNDKLIREAPIYAMKNKKFIEESELCGCYHCTESFSKNDITEWTDNGKTAICPFCKNDSVLGQSYMDVNKENLQIIHNYWFKNDKGPKP